MSSFIVSNETINRIVATLELSKIRNQSFPDFRYMDGGELLEMEAANVRTLGETLFFLNLRATIAERYPHNHPDVEKSINDMASTYRHQHEYVNSSNRAQVYKSLQCYLYQCSEGEIPNSPLYKALETYKAKLAELMVEDTQEYNEASWS